MAICIILGILFLLYAPLILYYRRGWMRIPDFRPDTRARAKVCVIIPARNEEANIAGCLQAILDNDYPAENLEIIVIDDYSTDNTAAVVTGFPGVRLIRLADHLSQNINSYKKKAIELGIAQTHADIIVCTDADTICTPYWIQTIVSFMQQHNSVFVSMPVRFKNSDSALGIFQELDFMTLQGITGAAVYHKMHSMSNGANLAYLHTAYDAVGGFAGINQIASGDDMLLMDKMAKQFPNRVHYAKAPELIVQTDSMPTVRAFMQQRIRWASKSLFYPDPKIKAVLLLVLLWNLMLLITPFISIFYNPVFTVPLFQTQISVSLLGAWLIILLLKAIVEWFFLYPVAKFFGREKLGFYFFLAQPFHIFYTVVAGMPRRMRSYEWKGRNVK